MLCTVLYCTIHHVTSLCLYLCLCLCLYFGRPKAPEPEEKGEEKAIIFFFYIGEENGDPIEVQYSSLTRHGFYTFSRTSALLPTPFFPLLLPFLPPSSSPLLLRLLPFLLPSFLLTIVVFPCPRPLAPPWAGLPSVALSSVLLSGAQSCAISMFLASTMG